jgi:hypothetical protein
MRLLTKWLLVSVGGGILATVALSTLPDRWIDAPDESAHPTADKVIAAVFWPITRCVHLSGHGAPVGPPEKHMYEASPVQVVAVFIGIGLSWVFYSSLVFLMFRWRKRHTKSATG